MKYTDYMSAVDLASDIKAKKISPVEVMEQAICMIEDRNQSINAFTFTAFDEAMEKARLAEKRLMSGDAQGAFFAIPTAAKDFLPGVPGWPGTSGGVRALSGDVDQEYGCYTGSMVSAGAILVGKTNAPSFAFRGTTDNKMFGPTSTPFKVGYNSGGSSGGSAAAVGDGIMQIAEGTDGGGSIRIPASWCGAFGYKASVGTVPSLPRPNAWTTSHPFCWDGTISRTVKDAAFALQEMAVFNPFDPFSVDTSKIDFRKALESDIKGLKIGFTRDWNLFPSDPEIVSIVERAAKRFEEAGAIVEEISFDWELDHIGYAEAWCRLITIQMLEPLEALKARGVDLLRDHQDDLSPEYIYWMNEAYRRSYVDFNNDFAIRTEVFDKMQTVFQDYDLIVSPVTCCKPVKNDPARNTAVREVGGVPVEPLIGYCETYFCNFTGHPACSIPAGMSSDGFPVGMQIIGRRFCDFDVLRASAVFEKIQPWASTYEITANRAIR